MRPRNDGSGWTSQFEPSPMLIDIWGTGADDVFVVGAAGAVYRRDATGWSREPQVTGAILWSVWIAPGPGGDILAVGDGGRIVQGARP